jgi:hypothetical protein
LWRPRCDAQSGVDGTADRALTAAIIKSRLTVPASGYTQFMTDRDANEATFEPQNPEPDHTTGLEAGGGVTPGDTPPAESSVGGPQHEPPLRGRTGPIIALSIAGFLVLIIVVGLIGRVVGLF